MITIRFKNHSNITVDITYDLDLIKIISTPSFIHYVHELHCVWAEVGSDGLTFVERLEKEIERN